MNIPTKNGIPWTGLYQFSTAVNPEYIHTLNTLFHTVNWGTDYENYRRQPSMVAIYPDTRVVPYVHNTHNQGIAKDLGPITVMLYEQVKTLFPQPMTLLFSELVLLTAHGQIPWHHDRMVVHSLSSRVMVPFTRYDENIEYSFSNWTEHVPADAMFFAEPEYVSSDVQTMTMRPGHYYVYNHRVPHKTHSTSDRVRGLLQMELIPTQIYENYQLPSGKTIKEGQWFKVYHPITDFEKTKILEYKDYAGTQDPAVSTVDLG
jgi:hypothetical protein